MNRPIATPRKRGRPAARARAYFLSNNPLCERCEKAGVTRTAVEVHHRVALAHGGSDDEANREAICDEHHRQVTAEQFGFRPKGGDADGMPTDPRHPWNL